MNVRRILFLLSALFLFLVIPVGSGRAAVNTPAESGETAGAGPTADWLSAVKSDISQREYAITWQENPLLPGLKAAYQAPNRAQNLRTYFTAEGVRLVPRDFDGGTPLWTFGMALSGYGYRGQAAAVDPPTLSAEENRMAYERPSLDEWYINDQRGLEQGYTLHQPPAAGPQRGEIVLTLTLTGNLAGTLAPDGQSVTFGPSDGDAVLQYDKLVVFDANGRHLPAAIELDDQTLRLTFSDVEAVYPITVDPLLTSPDWTAEGEQSFAHFGAAVGTAGDVNGDGFDDVIVGAPFYDNGQTDEGRVFIFHGSGAGPAAVASWTAESNQGDARFGTAVGTAGDVNGDGYDDIIIGAYLYSNGQTSEGRAFVYHGSAAGLAAAPAWTAESDQIGGYFGWSVGTAGDVNGDTYSDVIVGAYNYNNGTLSEGGAFVYQGSAAGLSAAPAWTAESNQADARFGWSVATAGDVNNDGYQDVIIGAPYYDNGQTNEGRVYLYHGSAAGLAPTPDKMYESNQAQANMGYAVGTAGDINGDGYSDAIIGAPFYDSGQTDEGRAYLYHGSVTGLGAFAAWITDGDQDGANYGWVVGTAGDVNGDGNDDILIGAPLYDNGQIDEGQSFLFSGSPAGLPSLPAWTDDGDGPNDQFGYAVGTAGDVNGDGYSDILVGARYYDEPAQNAEGKAFLYYGDDSSTALTADWSDGSNQSAANLGWAVSSAGDVNGDGYGDIIAGAPYFDNGQNNEGRAFLYLGSAAGLSLTADWTAESDQASALFGQAVATAGDVNGDGFSDVIIGAYNYDNGQTDEGRAYLYLGSAAGLGGTAVWTAESDQADARFGFSVATAGDVNGDGYSDVVVGAYRYDNGQADEGRAYVYHGSAGGLSAAAAWTGESDQDGASFGIAVGTAGDVNGDGYSDLVVGAQAYDNGQTSEGRAFVYHGSAVGLAGMAAWTAESDQAGARLGWSVGTAGDVNGDGFADVIVGAPFYDNGAESDAGRAFVYHGSPTGLSLLSNWTGESVQETAQFGFAVGTAGDVNGDGYADVIVGAPLYDKGQNNEGLVAIYNGSAAGLEVAAAWTAESDQDFAEMGGAVGTAGDVNGDGYSDILIGSRYHDSGQSNEGGIFVYYGRPQPVSQKAAWTFEGDDMNGDLGLAVSTAGDINGDGFDDVLIGAPSYDSGATRAGRVYLFLGSATGLSAIPDWIAEENQLDARFGSAVSSAGDVNGDGYSDVIIGAYNYDTVPTDDGRVYLYLGSPTGLSSVADWTAVGNNGVALFGFSVGPAGDVNGDGYSDVIVGEPGYHNGLASVGRAYVYYGTPLGLPATANWIAEEEQINALFGFAVGTAGDVNGDGYSDVVISAIGYDNGEASEGQAYVYHGSATGLATTADWTTEGDQALANYGNSVGTAGDVNGDGYSDLLIGASSFDDAYTNEGRAFLYYGSSAGLPTVPGWTMDGAQTDAEFGYPVRTAGDVNGDGYSDVIIGASGAENDQTSEGLAFIYMGRPTGLSPVPVWFAEGDEPLADFGFGVGSAGDVNGDGYGDVVVGAKRYNIQPYDQAGRTFLYYGNGENGRSLSPQLRRADDTLPVARLGQSISPTQARLALLGQSPYGRGLLRMQWEIKPEGVPFDGSGLGQGGWQDSGTIGYSFNELINGLSFESRYRWRVRLQYHPATSPFQSHSRWLYGEIFFTALSGLQTTIAPIGQTNLLGQSPYVDVQSIGALSTLTLRGYPQTAHPREDFAGGGPFMLDRYFTLDPNGGSGYEMSMCLNYDDAEVPVGTSESDLRLCRWASSGWDCPDRSPASDTVANLVCADNITELGDWTMGAVGPTVVFLQTTVARERGTAVYSWVLVVMILLVLVSGWVWIISRKPEKMIYTFD